MLGTSNSVVRVRTYTLTTRRGGKPKAQVKAGIFVKGVVGVRGSRLSYVADSLKASQLIVSIN